MKREKYNYECEERIIEITKTLNDLYFIMNHFGRRNSSMYKYDGFKQAVEMFGYDVQVDKKGFHTISKKGE